MARCDLHGVGFLKEFLVEQCGKKLRGQMTDHTGTAGQPFLMALSIVLAHEVSETPTT